MTHQKLCRALAQFTAGRIIQIVLSVFLLCVVLNTSGQRKTGFPFERISTDIVRFEKGLSQNTVQAAIQDHFGFMWFGTWDGLNKYDGYSYTIFNEEHGLSSQNVSALLEDHLGLIWIGTEDGLCVYDRITDTFTQYKHDHRDPRSLVYNRINCLALDQAGNIWVGTTRGISIFSRKTGNFENYRHDPGNQKSLSNSWINNILCDSTGRVWVGTFGGLDYFDPTRKIFERLEDMTWGNEPGKVPVFSLEWHNGKLWTGTENGLFALDPTLRKITRVNVESSKGKPMTDEHIYDILTDENGVMWLATNGRGIILFNPETLEIIRLRSEKNNQQSLSNDQVYSLYQDKAGIIWVGTYSGLNKFDRNSSRFRHFRHIPGDPAGLLGDVVFGFFEDDDGTIWIGSENGVNLFNPETFTFSLPKNPSGTPTPLVKGLVRTFCRTRDGNLWIGSSGGISSYNTRTHRLRHFTAQDQNPESLCNNFVWKILEDPQGYLWIGTERGLSRFDRKTESFRNYFQADNTPYTLPDNVIFDMMFDRKGRLWIATAGGLCWFDRVSERFYHAPGRGMEKLTSGQKRASGIYEDPNGVLWISTFGGGLMKYHPLKGTYRFYTDKDGLPNNVVYRVVDDGTGNLWVPTNRGLARFNIANETFVTYGLKDGVQSNEFNLGASLITRKGRLFFGGMNGFNTFYPDEIRKNENPARIAVSGFFIFDRMVHRELFDGDTIYLKYSENFFAFTFSALDFANPAKNQYKYFLENFEKSWNITDAYDRLAQYTNVPPGRYRFRVKGSNNDGIWNNEGIAITVIITPPWYATWLFRILLVLTVGFLIYTIIVNRLRRINRKHQIEKQFLAMERQFAELEQKALRLQMNPHFIFNTLNSIQSYMINNDADTAIEYLAKFARLMRQVLVNSRESYIPVKEELAALSYYLEIEQLRFNDKFTWNISADDEIDQEFTGIPPMILQPYVENAIIHGILYKEGKGEVNISIEQREDYLYCVIEDDGVGREAARQKSLESGLERKSSGMMITQQRLELLDRSKGVDVQVKVTDKTDGNGRPAGTRVEVKMPSIDI